MNELDLVISRTAMEFSRWIEVTIGEDIEIREKDYIRYKEYMKIARNYNSDKANKYREIMENLFSNMLIERDMFFGNIYISKRFDFITAARELATLNLGI